MCVCVCVCVCVCECVCVLSMAMQGLGPKRLFAKKHAPKQTFTIFKLISKPSWIPKTPRHARQTE